MTNFEEKMAYLCLDFWQLENKQAIWSSKQDVSKTFAVLAEGPSLEDEVEKEAAWLL